MGVRAAAHGQGSGVRVLDEHTACFGRAPAVAGPGRFAGRDASRGGRVVVVSARDQAVAQHCQRSEQGRVGLGGSIPDIYELEVFGSTEIRYEFYFDEDDNLISFEIKEFTYCL